MFPCMTTYKYFNPLANVQFHLRGLSYCKNPVFSWIAFGKLPQNLVVTPSATTQVVYPTAPNRYLQSVTVKPIPTTGA